MVLKEEDKGYVLTIFIFQSHNIGDHIGSYLVFLELKGSRSHARHQLWGRGCISDPRGGRTEGK